MSKTTVPSGVKSMTAFARHLSHFDLGSFSWEVRSVNQRYLEINPKLPDTYRSLEMPLRDTLKKHLTRGKVDVILTMNLNPSAQTWQVNQTVLTPLTEAICHIQRILPEASQVNPLEMLKWPGILQDIPPDEAFQGLTETTLLSALETTLLQLNAHRLREGAGLSELMLQRCHAIELQVETLQQIMPEILTNQVDRLKQRILSLSDQLDETRLHQEIAILAQKMDIEEELDRLTTHVKEVRHVLNTPGPIGRRLDFLMQELNREANTLGSKSIDKRTSQASVELKVLIEQIREQVQNIE